MPPILMVRRLILPLPRRSVSILRGLLVAISGLAGRVSPFRLGAFATWALIIDFISSATIAGAMLRVVAGITPP